MKDFFRELFAYSHHYNDQLLELFAKHSDKTTEKSVKLMNHILNAQHIWNCRINKAEPRCTIWGINELQELPDLETNNYSGSLLILEDFDLAETITYRTSAGELFQNSIRDILFHVINHSTYHRAQIATEFKDNDLEPVLCDYIFYKR